MITALNVTVLASRGKLEVRELVLQGDQEFREFHSIFVDCT